ncbi:prepilin peptidase [Methylosinus sp. Sm6]|uniref:prepilin peptidase n=1 Tax=Methylosinus sp. Sm6 TaxID=2866948 RepID=UPI001C996AE5|nr:prepilin peptidase [Methylosinus sp. Sm6]MBY6242696.1 prepilin peptidase [Methylosinus sp. Sm6]
MILFARGEGRSLAHVAWIALAGASLLLADAGSLGWWGLPTLALFASLALVALFDARYLLIPDGPLLVLLLCGAALLPVLESGAVLDRLAAAAGGYAALRGADLAYERLRGHAGLGPADARLLGLAGLWLGVAALPGCLLIACASALASALIEGRAIASARQPIPFGPHLALGFWLSWCLGPFEIG